MSGVGEAISRFTDAVGNSVSVTFKNISVFLDTILTFFVTMGFWISVLTFILIFIIMIFSPLWIVKFWDSINKQYTNLVNKFIKGISK